MTTGQHGHPEYANHRHLDYEQRLMQLEATQAAFEAALRTHTHTPTTPPTQPPPTGTVTITYTEDQAEVLNPGRGIQRSYEMAIGTWSSVQPDDRCVRRYLLLPVQEADLPQSVLDAIRRDLAFARSAGVLCDARPYYSTGFGAPEPSWAAIQRHQAQLRPIFHQGADVLNTLELGMIGPWGEQHTVRAAGFDEGDDAGAYPKRQTLLRGWLNGSPDNLVVSLRRPDQLRWMIEQGGLTAAETAKCGIYNDGYLRNIDHTGTFRKSPGPGMDDEKEWAEAFAKNHHSRAESNVELAEHAVYANSGDNWKTDGFERYSVDTLREWGLARQCLIPKGVWDEVKRRLGYRLVLKQAVLPVNVQPGQRITVELTIDNEGFAPPRRKRLGALYFGQAGSLLEGFDARTLTPGQRVVSAQVVVPPLPAGSHPLSLSLPDPYASLLNDQRYAIRLANVGLWDAGRNSLKHAVTV